MSHSENLRSGSLSFFFYQLAEGARRQSNVIFALIFRDLKNRSGDEYGMLSLVGIVIEPAISVLSLAAFWYILRRQDIDGIPVLLFLSVSVIPFTMVRRSLASIPRTVKTARAFFAFPNVKPFDAIVAQFIMEFTLTLFGAFLLLFMMGWFLGYTVLTNRILECLMILGLITIASFGISLFLGIYSNRYPLLASFISLMSRVLMLISAVMHPAAHLPVVAQDVLVLNPLAHAMELLRYYALGMKPFHGASLSFLTMFSLSSLSIGFIAYYANRKSIIELR